VPLKINGKKMKKTKKLFYAVASASLLAPALALAQWNPSNLETDSKLPSGTVYEIVRNGMMWILGIFGFIGIIGFVISGIMYLTSAGNEEQIKKAKSAMTWSLVGVVVGLIGLVIILAVGNALNAENQF
jgi:hypothetical protein